MQNNNLLATVAAGMHKLCVEGNSRPLLCSDNETVLSALVKGGYFLEANCGGRGVCGKCNIRLLAGKVANVDGTPASAQQGNVYRACQVTLCSDAIVRVKVPAASAKGGLTPNASIGGGQAFLRKAVLEPLYPEGSAPLSLQELLERALDGTPQQPLSLPVARQLAAVAAARPARLTAVLADGEVIAMEENDTSGSLYGVAFDIGTTTVVGMLVDVNRGLILASHGENNPQAAFGADVVSRIGAAAESDGLQKLAEVIRECLNRIVSRLCDVAKVSREQIYAATIVGNSTMEHLLLAVSPSSLVEKPYRGAFKQIAPFVAAQIGLRINAQAKVVLLPNIAGFIGADTTAAIVANGQDIFPGPSLLVDLGTNCELVMGTARTLFACSCAAGPAFEGAHIRDGMRAFAGAIDSVSISDDVEVRTIGDTPAAGICGSGMVKAVAELLKRGIITTSGRFDRQLISGLPDTLARRFKEKDNQWEFVLVEGPSSATGADISITQGDIRQIQLVKAAICSGIEILRENTALTGEYPVFLAGAFGNYIDVGSAVIIGLLPGISPAQVRPVGNSAGLGAVQALLSVEKLARCVNISTKINYIELAEQPNFQTRFLNNLAFPEVRE
jgi:Uncharacterized metal-binding protein